MVFFFSDQDGKQGIYNCWPNYTILFYYNQTTHLSRFNQMWLSRNQHAPNLGCTAIWSIHQALSIVGTDIASDHGPARKKGSGYAKIIVQLII